MAAPAGPVLGRWQLYSGGDTALMLIADCVMHPALKPRRPLSHATLVCEILAHVEVDLWKVTDAQVG